MGVRLTEEQRSRLSQLSNLTGLPVAELVRRAIETFVDDVEQKGELTLRWKEGNLESKKNRFIIRENP